MLQFDSVWNMWRLLAATGGQSSSAEEGIVSYDEEKVDEVVLALLYLTSFEEHGITRAWRGLDWGALDRLFEKGFIRDPRSKAKSVILTDGGIEQSRALFRKHFGLP